MNFKITETNTLLVKVAKLPLIGTNYQYVVQQLEPVESVPQIYSVYYYDVNPDHDEYKPLKKKLLQEWHDHVNQTEVLLPEDFDWMHKVDSVKIIECDLLTPKEDKK
jgi:hypothetical protein